MTSFRKFSIALLVVAALAGFMAAPAQAVTVSCNQPSTATVNVFFSMPCSASGGTAPYGFSITSGGLPSGLNGFASATEYSIQGTPLVAGSYTFTLTATDSANGSASQSYTVVVAASGGGGTGTGSITLVSVSPSTLTAGITNVVSVNGSNFTSSTIVYVNGVTVQTNYENSSTTLLATIPSSLVTGSSVAIYVRDPTTGTSGTLNVAVTGSGGTGSLSLSSLSPTSIPVNTSFTLTLIGSGFSSGQLVTFGGCTLGTTFLASSELTALIPSSCTTTASTINVAVGSSNTLQFTIGGTGSTGSGSISLTQISPTTLSPNTTVTMSLFGTNFTNQSLVYVNGTQVSTTYENSSTYLVATIPNYLVTSGTLSIYVRDPLNGTSGTLFATVSGSSSTGIISLTSISPTTLTPGQATSLILIGSNFTPNTVSHFNGSAIQPQYVSTTELIATIPASLVVTGTLPVYVSDATNGTSATIFVSVGSTGSTGGLSITSLSPSSAALNSGPLTLTIFGSGFSAGALLSFGSVCTLSTSFVSTSELQVTLPNSCLSTSQTVNVSVAGSNSVQFVVGAGGSTGTGSLSIICSPSTGPTAINSFYSQTCSVSSGTAPYTWTVTGLPAGLTQSAYTGGSSVTISGTPTTSQSYAYTVQVTDNTSPTHLTGSLSVTGTVGTGTTGYNITSLSPQTLSVGANSTNLSVFGNGFTGSSIVYFNGTPLSTTFVSSTQLYGLVPSTSLTTSQNASISVNTAGNYTNTLTLVIGSGSTGGGTITVTCSPGIGPQTVATTFSAVCSATGGAQPYNWTAPGLPSYLTLSASTGSSVTITGTPASAGPYNYTVRVSDSSSPVQTGSLQLAGQVTTTSSGTGGISITSLSPSSAPLNSGAIALTVNGSGFTSSSQVVFDGFAVVTTFLNTNQLTATIPAGQFTFARAAQVSVTTAGVGTSNSLSFVIGNGVANQISITCTPGVGPSSPNSYYASTCSVNGGTAPFNWTISSGALPTGLTFSPNGVTTSINGFTTLNGVYSYTLQVTDSSNPPNTATAVFAGTTGPGGTSSNGVSISSLSPSSAAPGSQATTITINGTGFVSGATAYFNGTPLSTTFVSSGALTAVIPANLLTNAVSASITVISSGLTSNGFTFTVGATTTTGISVSCTPNVGPTTTSSYSTTCTATGGKAPYTWSIVNGFLPQGLVLSNSNSSTVTISGLIFVSGSQISLPYSFGLQVSDSSTPVQQSTFPFAGTLSVTAVGTITSLNPSSAPVGGGQFTLAVTGNGFQSGLSTVYWNGTPLATSYISTTQVSAIVPSYLLATIGPANISVQTSGFGVTSQVAFFVSGATAVLVAPTSLSFTYGLGGTLPTAQNLNISSTIALTGFNVSVSALSNNITWLSASPSSSTVFPSTVTVNVAPNGLPIGTYNGSITVTGFGVGTGVVIPVSLTVTGPPTMVASPLSLSFTTSARTTAGTQTVKISASDGNTAFPFSVQALANNGGSWLSVTPTSATTPATLTITANAASLPAATYSGAISVAPTGSLGNVISVPVTFTVTGATQGATLSVSPQTLTFNATSGAGAPAAQAVNVTSTNGIAASYTVTATSTGNWLAATASGTTPGVISVSVNSSALAGGQYTGSLSIASPGATNTPQTVQVTLNVSGAASISAAPQSLSFFVPGDGSTPSAQTVTIISTGGNTAFTATAVSQGGNWLSVSGGGQTPGTLTASVNPSGLVAGQSYNGSINVSGPGSTPSSLQIPVTLTVAATGAVPLQAAPSVLYLSYTQGAGTDIQHIVVLNNGGGSVNYTVQGAPNGPALGAPPSTCGNWLNVITPSGTATASTPGVVAFTVNPGSVSSQTCDGTITINTPNGQTAVPIFMAISSSTQSVLLSQTAMNFVAASSGTAPAAQTFQILNPGSGSMAWSVAATTLSGGTWLSATPNSGTAQSLSQPGTAVSVSVNPQGLAAGTYYGTVQVTASGVANSAQSITVTLNVLASGTNPPPQVTPTGVILTGTNGNASTQTVNVTNPGSASLSYTAVLTTDDGQSWLTASPASGSISAGGTNAITLTATLSNAGTGLRHGSLRLVFSNGTLQTVDVELAVSGAASGSTGVHSCGSSDLAMEFLSPQQNFQATAQVAVPLQVLVQDCNGNALTSSNTGVDVLVGTSNTDVRLNYTGNGIWTGTWTPGSAASATSINARAVELAGSSTASGSITANLSIGAAATNAPPYISGVVNAGSFTFPGLVAPGMMVSIFGSNLADGTVQVQSTPFPNSLQGAQFTVRGLTMPLFYASSGQVNAVLPIGLTPDVRDQLIVVRDTTQSAPVDVLVADTAPGIFTVNSQGTGQAAALVNGTAQIAAPAGSIPGANTAPTSAGQTISLFLSGMGTVTNPPADGSPSTGSSFTTATPIVSIGGVPATVAYTGLAPGEVGLYQLNVVVPAGTMTGDAVPVNVSIGNQSANMVTIAIQ